MKALALGCLLLGINLSCGRKSDSSDQPPPQEDVKKNADQNPTLGQEGTKDPTTKDPASDAAAGTTGDDAAGGTPASDPTHADTEPDDGAGKPYEGRESLIRSVGRETIFPYIASFHSNLMRFEDALSRGCGEETKAVWLDLYLAWQRIEPFRIGPLAENGGNLRLAINSWPLRNTCGIDREVVRVQEPGFTLPSSFTKKGLVAAEYLLFDADLNHACPATVPETKTWNELPEEARLARRCAYIKLLAEDLKTHAKTLLSAWDPTQGDYTQIWLTQFGKDKALEQLIHSLYFIDTEMKDGKLSHPLGIAVAGKVSCQKPTCPEMLELPDAKSARESLLANAEAIRRVLTEDGLMEEVTAVGGGTVAKGFISAFDRFIAHLRSNQGSFFNLVSTMTKPCVDKSEAPMCVMHRELKEASTIFKNEMRVLLKVQAPARASGDND